MTMYAVRNKDGQYFHAKGYCGHGDTWVDSLKKARIYPKPGPARAQVTFFANKYPNFGVPELVELRITEVVVLDEEIRVKKSRDRKLKKVAELEKRNVKYRKERAEKQIADAQKTLETILRGVK
jgi:hypothetical protein